MVVLAHIAGASGSGKTTLGNKLAAKYPFLYIIDLDNVFKNLPQMHPHEWIKCKSDNDRLKYQEKYFEIAIQKIIDENDYVIFTGINKIFSIPESKFIELHAKYKYYIDIPVEQIMRQRFERQLHIYNTNVDFFFDRMMNGKPIHIDVDSLKSKIINNEAYEYYCKNNYKFLKNNFIFKRLIKKNR